MGGCVRRDERGFDREDRFSIIQKSAYNPPVFRQFFSVGAFTALSRLTGFFREMVVSALMGSGALADAYFIALRLPNQFRAIFGEGAFNAAYVPAYARLLNSVGQGAARLFAARVLSVLALSQLVFLLLAYLFMPAFVAFNAPGFSHYPAQFALAVDLSRVTFPYLALITLATLHSATLNAHGYFSVSAFAPVLLNLFVMGFLAFSFAFPNAAYAASWGVLISGFAQLALLIFESYRRGVWEGFAWPRWDKDMQRFLAALGPAVVGSAGQQIAILADSILASRMPSGSVSAINYADRLYQLPLGVIGVAAGSVLLPEIMRKLAARDLLGAQRVQNRSMALSLVLMGPFFVAFLVIPDVLIRGAYMRGAFSATAVSRAAEVLAAYGLGLVPMVLIRSAVAPFQARGDTKTPARCFYMGLAFNMALKISLGPVLGVAGLALATAVGAWINFALLVYLAHHWRLARFDDRLVETCVLVAFAAAGAALMTLPAHALAQLLALRLPVLRHECVLVLTFGTLSLVYIALFLLASRLFGRRLRHMEF